MSWQYRSLGVQIASEEDRPLGCRYHGDQYEGSDANRGYRNPGVRLLLLCWVVPQLCGSSSRDNPVRSQRNEFGLRVLAAADQSQHVGDYLAGERGARAGGLRLRRQLDDLPWEC
jgi:hypothetical protein